MIERWPYLWIHMARTLNLLFTRKRDEKASISVQKPPD